VDVAICCGSVPLGGVPKIEIKLTASVESISIGRSSNLKIGCARNDRCNFFYMSKFNDIFI
jgi:hypothetical protein